MAESVHAIDWASWKPQDVATLCFVIRGGEALLIRKLRGLGAGKINAPGGRLEPGESPEQAAIREVIEEVGVTPKNPRHRGELRFQFVDGYLLHCHVFTADECEGEAHDTEEAIVQWTRLDALPYGEMWADDALWLPLMLSGRTPFDGRFIFDGEKMVDHVITSTDPALPLFERLASLGISFESEVHPPVFTVEQAKRHRGSHGGRHTKNLFVRNKKGRQWLVTLEEDRAVDLKQLAAKLDAGHLSFGSPQRLRAALGVEAGSVTPLAILNDREGAVTMVVDAALAGEDLVHVHPLTNDRTIAMKGTELLRFIESTGHAPILLAS